MQIVVSRNGKDEHLQRYALNSLAGYNNACAVVRDPLQYAARLAPPVTFLWIPGVAVAMTLRPASAWAHVKWFEPYDVSVPPASVATVITQPFVLTLVGFTVL